MKFVFVAGIPASGKSTYCGGRDAAVFSFDSWLSRHYGEADVEKAGWMFITDPQGLDEYLNAVARAWRCITDFDFYLDDGAVDRKRRKAIIAGLKKRGIDHIHCVYLLCPMYVAAERNIARRWPISRDNFYQACTRQEYPTEDEGFDSVKFVVTGEKVKITVVIPDKTVVVDGVGYTVAMPAAAEEEAFYSIVWDGEKGEADRNNGTEPVKLTREDYGRLVYPYYLAWQNAKAAADKEAEIVKEAAWAMYNSPEALWHRLRKERNKRLSETDYVFAPDYPALTSESLGAVKSYRQALRDLPSQPGAPWADDTVPWPAKPVITIREQ